MRTNIYLEARQSAALDDAARARGISRARLVRQLIDGGIGTDSAGDLEADLAALDASFGILSHVDAYPDVARGPDARSRHLKQMASKRAADR